MPEPRPWLPGESLPRARPRTIAITLALALLCLVAINLAAGHLLDRAGNNLGYRLMDQKWALARDPGAFSPDSVVLVIGDSSGNQGVDPKALAEALGEPPTGREARTLPRVLNLCTVADALVVHDAWILRRWIDLHGPPAGVAIVHTYDVWFREANSPQGAAIFARVPTPLWQWGAAKPNVHLSPANWATLLSSRWVPLYSQDASLRDLLGDPARTWDRYTTNAGIIWQTVDKDGFLSVSVARAAAVERDARFHMGFLHAGSRPNQWTRFHASLDNAAALEELARLAKLHKFPVWIAAAPMYRGLWEAPAMRAYHADLREWLGAFEREHPEVRVVLGQPTPFEADQMQNADHVIKGAAAEYARRLGEAIRAVPLPVD